MLLLYVVSWDIPMKVENIHANCISGDSYRHVNHMQGQRVPVVDLEVVTLDNK